MNTEMKEGIIVTLILLIVIAAPIGYLGYKVEQKNSLLDQFCREKLGESSYGKNYGEGKYSCFVHGDDGYTVEEILINREVFNEYYKRR